jgi:hypothetical protein
MNPWSPDEYAPIEKLRRENDLKEVHCFDIGRNSDGYSGLIREVMSRADMIGMARDNLINYPDNHYNLLRNQLARIFGLDPSRFVLSAGLEDQEFIRLTICLEEENDLFAEACSGIEQESAG